MEVAKEHLKKCKLTNKYIDAMIEYYHHVFDALKLEQKAIYPEYDYYVFITRKCYYTFLLLNYNEDFINIYDERIIRDRDIIKDFDFSIFVNKKVLLLDDTVRHGSTVVETAKLIKKYANTQRLDATTFGIDILYFKYPEKMNDLTIYYHQIMASREIAEFINDEMIDIHNNMISYVIELPVFGMFRIPTALFKQMIERKDRWQFHDYSFKINRNEYQNGYFRGYNQLLSNKFGNVLIDITVKCRYRIDGDEVLLNFTPFVNMDSMDATRLRRIYYILFNVFAKEEGASENHVGRAIGYYRYIIYALSYYVGLEFRKYLMDTFDYRFELEDQLVNYLKDDVITNKILPLFQDGSSQLLINRLLLLDDTIEESPYMKYVNTNQRDTIPYASVLEHVMRYLNKRKRELDYKRNLDEPSNDVKKMMSCGFDLIFQAILEKVKTVSSLDVLKTYFTNIVYMLLDTSFFSNTLQLEETDSMRVIRQLKFGENSNVFSVFDMRVFYAGIYTFFNKMKCEKAQYDRYYDDFIHAFLRFLIKEEYLNYGYITKDCFEHFKEYFDFYENEEREFNDLRYAIENKRFVLKDNLKYEDPYIQKVIRFVNKLTFEERNYDIE